MNIKIGAMQGWQCPVCGFIWNWTVQGCLNCNRPEHEKYTTTDTSAVPDGWRKNNGTCEGHEK